MSSGLKEISSSASGGGEMERFDPQNHGGSNRMKEPLTSHVVVNRHGLLATGQVLVIIFSCEANVTFISQVKVLRWNSSEVCSSDLLAQEEPAH